MKLTNRGYEEWTYVGGYVATDNFVLYRPYPQTGRYAALRRKFLGACWIATAERPRKVVFVRLPRGPIPRPDNPVQKKSSSNNVRRNGLGLHLAQKQLIVLVAGLCQVLRPARFRVVDESVHISIKPHREVSQRY